MRAASELRCHLTDLRWLGMLGALLVIGEDMMADTMPLENICDVFSVDDEGPWSEH